MVKSIWICLLSLLLFISLEAEPLVEASIESVSTQAHFPLEGTITITHQKSEAIDPQSFLIEGKPLEASLVREVKMSASSDTVVSFYTFQIPGKDQGDQLLPPITVKVGGKSYSSIPSVFEVQGQRQGATTKQAPRSSQGKLAIKPIVFRLEAFVEGPSFLYPGERTKLAYKIFYSQSVDLNRSNLPMVHPDHLKKVGDVQIQDYQLPEATVQKLTQEVEASELGTFTFGPSSIEGYAYTMEGEKKLYGSDLLKAEAPPVSIEVRPFPESVQPPSFTGGLGKIEIKAELINPTSAVVGESVQVKVQISGVENLADFHLPPLECQPGFSGFFQTNGTPPLSDVKEQEKIFIVELRPLTALAGAIPSIQVSSFDPISHEFIVKKSDPIQLKIKPASLDATLNHAILPVIAFASKENWPSPPSPPLEIESPLPTITATFPLQKENGIIGGTVLAFILVVLQMKWRKAREERPKPQAPASEELFKQALKKTSLKEMEEALKLRIQEKGIYLEKRTDLQDCFAYLEALQYGPDRGVDFSKLKRELEERFQSI